MKKILGKVALGLVAALSFLGFSINNSTANVQKGIMSIKETTPLYLQHSATQRGEGKILLADHESHYSHSSHESHYSHYSSRY